LADWKEAIDKHLIAIYDKPTIEEHFSFILSQTSSSVKAMAETNAHDDLVTSCFAGDTNVLTDRGQVPIKDIRVGDLVITREGLKPVTSVIQHIKPVIYNKYLDLLGTPDHPVITKGGIVRLDNTKESDIVYMWDGKQLSIEERNIADILTQRGDSCRRTVGNREKKTPIFTKNLIKTILKALLVNPKQRFVKNVEKPLLIEEEGVQNIAQTHVEQRAEEEIVYNLSVKDCPEYFANNILVHNCAIVYQLYQTEEPTKLKVDFKDFPDDSKLFNGGFY